MVYALAKRILQDIYDLLQLIFKGCRFLKNIYLKRQKLQRKNGNAGKTNVSDKVSFLKRTKQRRKKLLKMRLNSSEDIVDVETNAVGQISLLGEPKTDSVFEFVN